MKTLESITRNQLINCKEECWENSHLNPEKIKTYAEKVREYKAQGYDMRVHEYVIEQLKIKLRKQQ